MSKKLFSVLFMFFLVCLMCFSLGEKDTPNSTEKVSFTDSCRRTVFIDKEITKVAVSGSTAKMFLDVISPEFLVPYSGSLYGGKSTINVEELLSSGAQIVIDIGSYRKGIEDSLDEIQNKTGIPCIFINGDIENMSHAFRILGNLLNCKKDRAEQLALFVDRTLSMVQENSEKIKEDERKTVMFSGGADGLGTNAKGSSQAQVLELVGCNNAVVVNAPVSKANGNRINMEMLYNFDPDFIFLTEDCPYIDIISDSSWSFLSAIKQGQCYEVPCKPYCWLGNPPSLNMLLGIWYLGNLVYPQYYNYDINEVAKEFYSLFWNTDCPYTLETTK